MSREKEKAIFQVLKGISEGGDGECARHLIMHLLGRKPKSYRVYYDGDHFFFSGSEGLGTLFLIDCVTGEASANFMSVNSVSYSDIPSIVYSFRDALTLVEQTLLFEVLVEAL